MSNSPVMTLFAEAQLPRRQPTALAVSAVVHGIGFGLFVFAVHAVPEIIERDLNYPVKMMSVSLSAGARTGQADAGSGVVAPALSPPGASSLPGASPSPGVSSPPAVRTRPAPGTAAAVARVPIAAMMAAHVTAAAQTLVEPDLPEKIVLLRPVPLPRVVLWKPETMPVSKIIPPKAMEARATLTKPSLTPPNHEKEVADERVSASFAASARLPMVPANSSPMVVRGPQPVEQLAETTAKTEALPTPTSLLSITPIRLVDGTVALPAANQTAAAASDVSRGAGAAPSEDKTPGDRSAPPDARTPGEGREKLEQGSPGPGNRALSVGVPVSEPGSVLSSLLGSVPETGASNGSKKSLAGGSNSADAAAGAPDAGDGSGTERLVYPRNGRFGAVVVGASLEEDYPESRGMLADRLAYTVYLHVGQARNWILQYTLLPGATASSSRPEAPWPYDIVRPDFAPGEVNAEAILVHGLVNTAGRFEQLSVAFPPLLAQSKFLISALSKWQFRPAMEQGQPIAVEVLLIIPTTLE